MASTVRVKYLPRMGDVFWYQINCATWPYRSCTFGIVKTKSHTRSCDWFPRKEQDIESVRNVKPDGIQLEAPTVPYEWSHDNSENTDYTRWCMETMSPIGKGKSTVSTSAEIIMEHSEVFPRHGLPEHSDSDTGWQLESGVFWQGKQPDLFCPAVQ